MRLLRELNLGDILAEDKPMDWLTVYGPDGVELDSALVGTERVPAEGYAVDLAPAGPQRIRAAC